MPTDASFAAELAHAIADVAEADLVVGIPSYRNAATIGHVVSAVRDGLRAAYPDLRAVIVNSDGGSDDGTRDVAAGLDGEDVRVVSGRYAGPSGKGSALRAVFEALERLDAKAGAVLDSDLRSVTPEWVGRLLRPVVEGRADYVTPLYLRHKHDGTITNTVAYPVVRALYGKRVRQPIGGEFGFSGALARRWLAADVWRTDVARFGIDVFMTTTALASGARVVQAALGAKIHDPKDPAAHLPPMFRQVLGSLAARIDEHRSFWTRVQGSEALPIEGALEQLEPGEVRVDVGRLDAAYLEARVDAPGPFCEPDRERFDAAARAHRPADEALDLIWARLVYDVLGATLRDSGAAAASVDSLLPLYLARVAMHVRAADGMTSADAERLVERQALAFEAEKAHLLERAS